MKRFVRIALTRLLAALIFAFLSGWNAYISNLYAAPPPGDPSPVSPLGKELYNGRCTICHGAEGKGDGVAAALLHPRPRDFNSGKYKFRSTESGGIPTDQDLERTIRSGLHSTAMPDWKDFISGDSLNAIVQYV